LNDKCLGDFWKQNYMITKLLINGALRSANDTYWINTAKVVI